MTIDFEKVLLIQHLQDVVSTAKAAFVSEGDDDWCNLKAAIWDAQIFLAEVKDSPYKKESDNG